MKVLLIQVDGKLPNLALMTVSAYHKSQGDTVKWAFANPDKVYISCVFSENLPHARGIPKYYPDSDVKIGGPALGYPNALPEEMKHIMPDYSLYPDMDYSIGFTTRGCIRSCPFCIVPQIEGPFQQYDHPEVFCNPDFDKVVLFDNNLLASRFLIEDLKWIKDQGLKVCFNQGLDARLVTEDIAKTLKEMKAYNLHFTKRTYYFSWDLVEEEEGVLRGLERMVEAGVKPRSLMVYLLVGFNTSHNQDLYRFEKLIKFGAEPFVMIYNNRKDDPWIRHFARYVNKRVYKVSSLEDYERYNLLNSLQGRKKEGERALRFREVDE